MNNQNIQKKKTKKKYFLSENTLNKLHSNICLFFYVQILIFDGNGLLFPLGDAGEIETKTATGNHK